MIWQSKNGKWTIEKIAFYSEGVQKDQYLATVRDEKSGKYYKIGGRDCGHYFFVADRNKLPKYLIDAIAEAAQNKKEATECKTVEEITAPELDDIIDYKETTMKKTEIAHSLHRALHDFKESGETRVKDPQLEEMIILELLESGVSVIRYKYDDHVVIELEEE